MCYGKSNWIAHFSAELILYNFKYAEKEGNKVSHTLQLKTHMAKKTNNLIFLEKHAECFIYNKI